MIRVQLGDKEYNLSLSSLKMKKGFILLLFLLILFALFKSFYTVAAEEEAVVLRFGKHIKTVPPGLHFRIPFGVDDVIKVPVTRQLKQEFGFGTKGNTNKHQWSKEDMVYERTMVTGDLNSALVEWVIQYRITEPEKYLFKVRNADATLRDASESVMREVVGDRTVDEVITVGRQEIESESQAKLKSLVKLYEMGITIDQVQLKDVNPPRAVQASFNEVNRAQQDRERVINVANGKYNKLVPMASGAAQKMISQAEGYAIKRVNESQGNVSKFTSLLKEYERAPNITYKRIYLETMANVIPKLKKKVIIDESLKSLMPLYPIETNKK